jgi:hypothetical protein
VKKFSQSLFSGRHEEKTHRARETSHRAGHGLSERDGR